MFTHIVCIYTRTIYRLHTRYTRYMRSIYTLCTCYIHIMRTHTRSSHYLCSLGITGWNRHYARALRTLCADSSGCVLFVFVLTLLIIAEIRNIFSITLMHQVPSNQNFYTSYKFLNLSVML